MSLELVKEFNTAFGVAMHVGPHLRRPDCRVRSASLRYKLIKEEFGELLEAIDDADLTEVADALGDIKYVVDGAALVFGTTNINSWVEKPTDSGKPNPLYDESAQALILERLRFAILRNETQLVEQLLAYITHLVYRMADELDIDLHIIVEAIHQSNMSKLGEDGKPIYREGDNKVLKGPNYTTPTEDIQNILFYRGDSVCFA